MARPHVTTDVFGALAHPVRRRLLELLRDRPRSAGELAANFRVSQPTVCVHVRVLRQCGLVTFRVRGNQHVYSLVPGSLAPALNWVARFNRRG